MVLCMSSMILGGCIPSPKKQTEAITVEENPNMMYMLVGSYATPEEEGIKVYNFDEQNGNSQYISGIKGISNPSFLIPSADGERIYAVGEDSGKSSTANAIKFDKEQKKLTLLNSQPTDGGAPCYITLSPSEKFVLTANYIGGSITVFPLDKDGKLKSETRLISFTGNSLDKERQTQPHLHCIEFTPDHKYLLASDLGTDQIHVFPVSENVTDGVSHSLLNESEEFNIKVESGSGPRHRFKNPIHEVGVTKTYGIDDPAVPLGTSGIRYVREHSMTPSELVAELKGFEGFFFKTLFAGNFAKKLYRMHEYQYGY